MSGFLDVLSHSKFIAVMEDTWGHLSIQKGVYDLSITLAVSEDSNNFFLLARDGIPNSPYEFELVGSIFDTLIKNQSGYRSSRLYIKYEDAVERPGVYQFKGKVVASDKNTISRVSGVVKRIFTWEAA